MIVAEFHAWFEGYTERMGDRPPDALEWRRIKEKIAQLTTSGVALPLQPWVTSVFPPPRQFLGNS